MISRTTREINKNIPIIAQTGYAMQDDIRKIAEAGFDSHITKPIFEDQLIEVLSKNFQRN